MNLDEHPLEIRFFNYKDRLVGETKSKQLDPESEFYMFIWEAQERLKHAGFRLNLTMPPCVQVLTQNEPAKNKDLFLKRVKELHGKFVNVHDKSLYVSSGKQFYLTLPEVDGLVHPNSPKVVIAYLNHLAPNKDRFLNIILDPKYSTFSDWEYTGSNDL